MTEQVSATSLVEDLSLYPRNQIDDTHMNDLVRALASGAAFPPIVVERSTTRIVDGVHRRRALMKFNGDETTVDVEFREYADDAAFYLDAVRLNAQHGRKLDRHDHTRIVLKLQELHVEPRIIASALHVPEPEVRTLAVRIVRDTSGTAFPQKTGLTWARGRTLSDEQLEAMKSVRSADPGRCCFELIRLIENDLIDYDDLRVCDRLEQLLKVLSRAMKKIQKARKHQKEEAVSA